MKRSTIAATILAALCIVAMPFHEAFAHGGGLDRHGCHHETATGGYHCHRGQDERRQGDDDGGEDDSEDWQAAGAILGGLIVAWLLIKAFQSDSRGHGLDLAPEVAADQTGNAYAGVRLRLPF